ncbi:PilZ domain-containing protein [Halobacteriovorax sp. ZH4_bin.1]|uniref:PilZ domain-containing protein n=1 Tax=unclassified Halobacteriovorax TaxID=2639665 RepID=UPI00371E32BA
MKKLFIADTFTTFREIDINDLYVEALSGVVFSNQYGFDVKKSQWFELSKMSLPRVVIDALKPSPESFEKPQSAPDGHSIKKEELEIKSTHNNELLSAISKIVKDEVSTIGNQLRDEFGQKISNVEERIGDITQLIGSSGSDRSEIIIGKLESILDETNLISDVNRKITKVLSTARELGDGNSNSQEYQAKFNALKIKYKNLAVENKIARKNLSKVIAKAKALNAKLEVAEKELENFKSYTDSKIGISAVNEEVKIEDVTPPEQSTSAGPKINLISRDSLVLEDEDRTVEIDLSEEATGEFDISSGGLEIATRAQVDDLELDRLNIEGLKNGKSFEISNKKSWQYDTGAGVVGPLRFDEMLVDLEKNIITSETLVKKKAGAPWVAAKECLELNTQAQLVSEDKENPENNKYQIERTEYRVDLQELVSFSLVGVQKDYKGYLTNLSLSGGFVEVTKFEKEFDKNTRGTIYISEGLFGRALAVDFTIMRASKNRPRGFGLRFESVSDSIMEVIGERMIEILNNNDDSKKAA